MKKTLYLAAFLFLAIGSLAMASWEPVYDSRNGFDVEPVAVESYEIDGITWNRFVANREDWGLEDTIGFEIDLLPPSNHNYCSGSWFIDPKTKESSLAGLYFWTESMTEGEQGPIYSCSLLIDRASNWGDDFSAFVKFFEDGGEVVQSTSLDNHPHFLGYFEYQTEEWLSTTRYEEPATERWYLGKNGEVFVLTTTLKNPEQIKHFFDSFRILD